MRVELLLAFLVALPAAAQDDRDALAGKRLKVEGTTPVQWRVIWTDNPHVKATVSWSTAKEGSSHVVHFGTKPAKGKHSAYTKKIAAQRNGQYTGSPEIYYHHATITGLKPDTTYYFVMASDKNVSRELHFRTAPGKSAPFKLIHGGDSRSNPDRRRRVNRLIAELAARDPSILAFAHGGDYIVKGTKLDQWHTWMSDHEVSVTDKGRILPIIPARGNHERSGPQYDEVFNTPGGEGKNYFTTNLGPDLVLVTLNSNISTAGDQAKFLEASLRANAKVRWQLAQYHRPVYPAVKTPSGNKKDWVPIFEKYNLDLACEADGHCIKRTVPIRNEKPDPTGVVYIGEGGLGVGQRTPKKDRWYLKPPAKTGSEDHVFVLSFSARALEMTVVLANGKLFDRYLMKPRKR